MTVMVGNDWPVPALFTCTHSDGACRAWLVVRQALSDVRLTFVVAAATGRFLFTWAAALRTSPPVHESASSDILYSYSRAVCIGDRGEENQMPSHTHLSRREWVLRRHEFADVWQHVDGRQVV